MQLTSADAEFILATQPLDLASYDRTHLPDGRLTPAVRYNVYLLSTDRVTIDLCMPKAPQHIASFYPRSVWNATIRTIQYRHRQAVAGQSLQG